MRDGVPRDRRDLAERRELPALDAIERMSDEAEPRRSVEIGIARRGGEIGGGVVGLRLRKDAHVVARLLDRSWFWRRGGRDFDRQWREGARGGADDAVGRPRPAHRLDRVQRRDRNLGRGRMGSNFRSHGQIVLRNLRRERGHDRAALFQLRLPRKKIVNFALEGILVQQLPAGDAIELGAGLCDTVLVGVPHFDLVGEIDAEHFVVKRQVERRPAAPQQGERQKRNDRPQRQRPQRERPQAVATTDRKKIMRPRQLRLGKFLANGHRPTLRSAKITRSIASI